MMGRDMSTVILGAILYASWLAPVPIIIYGTIRRRYRAILLAAIMFLPAALIMSGYPGLRYVGPIVEAATLLSALAMYNDRLWIARFMAIPIVVCIVGLSMFRVLSESIPQGSTTPVSLEAPELTLTW